MKRVLQVMATVAVAGLSLTTSSTGATARTPRIVVVGNNGICSLSSHKTFHMELSGWKAGARVQIKVYYANGTDYPFALRNKGVVTVDSNGGYVGHPWECWPNKTYPVSDRKTWYIVFAFQLGSRPLLDATSVFRVVK